MGPNNQTTQFYAGQLSFCCHFDLLLFCPRHSASSSVM
uniref:Uncharacterized protein n=1 Tax=Anguilla anguilla TaxID=7936 RepID=A0A0E9QB22_ANGAN